MRISFLTALLLGYVIYKIIKVIVQAQRDTKLAQVKADLKMRLLERVQDPELLRDILEQDLDLSPEGLQLHKEAWDKNQARAEASVKRKDGGWRFVSGMVFFFIGVGLLLMAIVGGSPDADEAWAPAIFFILYGWFMLGWHVYSQERRNERSANSQDLDAGRTST